MLCLYILLIEPPETVWSDLHTSISPGQHIAATYGYFQTCHVSCFILRVRVVYPCSLYHN